MTAAPPGPKRAGLGLVVLAAGLVVLCWYIRDLLLVAFIAILLAVYLGGLTDQIVRLTRLPRGPALLLSLAMTLLALIGIGFLVAPAVVAQTEELIQAVPGYLSALDRWVQDLANRSVAFRQTAIASSETGVATLALNDAFEFARRSFLAYATGTGRILIDGAAVIAMGLYLAWKPSSYIPGMVLLVPPVHRVTATRILKDAADTIRAWVGAQLLAMIVLAVATAVGLLILDVPYWMAFGLLAGVAVMVPFFGSLTSTILPALLVLPGRGPIAALAVAMVGVVVHLVEANIVHPLIMQHRVSLPPALTILAVLVMGALAGLLGMIVAVPLLATIIVFVRHILIYQTYGDSPASADDAHAVLTRSRPSMPALPALTR